MKYRAPAFLYKLTSSSGFQLSAFHSLITSLNPNFDGCPYFSRWILYCREPSSYIFLAYQSPASGWHCGPQCAHMPNLASRNQSGVVKFCNDSQVGANGPFAMGSPG